jgi:hypothetical protein
MCEDPSARRNAALTVACLVLCGPPCLLAQTAEPVRRAEARRISEPPDIDGVLDDRVWQTVAPLTDFVQAEPQQGEPATERTEVRIAYDDRTLFVGVTCYDSDPAGIITTDSRRDSSLQGQDSFQMIFDTYHDRQNGFVFGTSPVGILYDAQVRNEGETLRGGPPGGAGGGGNRSGSGAGVNVNWDGVWSVRTSVTEAGWSAEFAIPFTTLRYGPPPQVWGVNFSRTIERKREDVYWSPVARIYSLTRLSAAGELGGLELRARRDFKIMPYALSSASRQFTPGAVTDYDGNWGLDSKIGLGSALTLDLTYNTDFAQVEVDEQQINLTRFNLLFPEKRPFFLENRGLFAVGRPGEVDLFYSRQIGIAANGDPVPIRGGARLTGQARGVNVGLLNMQTRPVGCGPEAPECLASNNFTAVRFSKDLARRSSVGGLFVNRSAVGEYAGPNDWNRTWGADGRLGISEEMTLSGFAARTETPGASRPEHAFGGAFEFRTPAFEASMGYTEVGDDFNPEVGFLERDDGYRQVTGRVSRHVRTSGLAGIGVREWEPHASYESYWGFDGFQETATLHLDNRWDFENNYSGSAALNVQYEGLREPFRIYPGVIVPPGQYTSPYALLNASTDRRQWLSGSMSASLGGFLTGSQIALAPSVTIRDGARLNVAFRWSRNDIDLPQGAFVTNLANVRATYNFTTSHYVQALVQYNDRSRRWSSNVRFTWQQTATTGLYVVYNDTEGFGGLGPIDRTFAIKYTYLWDVGR